MEIGKKKKAVTGKEIVKPIVLPPIEKPNETKIAVPVEIPQKETVNK